MAEEEAKEPKERVQRMFTTEEIEAVSAREKAKAIEEAKQRVRKQGEEAVQVLEDVQSFLGRVGYELTEVDIPKKYVARPDFYAERKENETTHIIAGRVEKDIAGIAAATTHFFVISTQLGRDIDYVLALPPINEQDFIEVMRADNYKVFKKVRRGGYQIWSCNPKEKSICCVFGTPKDSLFTQHIKFKDLKIESHTSSGGQK